MTVDCSDDDGARYQSSRILQSLTNTTSTFTRNEKEFGQSRTEESEEYR